MTPQVFHILLSLAAGERHGYAIIQDVRDRTHGATRLTASTLYAALERLLDAGLIDEVDARDDTAGPPRRCYRLTRRGGAEGRAEAARLEALTAQARKERWLPRRRSAR